MKLIKYKYSGKGFAPYLSGLKSNSYEKEFLIRFYRDMLRIRLIEEEIERRYHEDEMKSPIHLVIGQEASSVGSCGALRPEDQVYCGHRTHGIYLAKGGNLKAMMSELYCRTTGCAGSRGGSMHLFDKSVGMAGSSAIVAGAIPIATGAALKAQLTGESWIVAAFLGDAAVEEGAFWEAVNFAVLKRLPILYFCENNFFSVCSPIEVRQPENAEIYKKAESFGLKSVKVDGTNVLEVYEASRNMVEYARSGKGPAFIESVAYRWRGHGGAGDDSHTGYRDPTEVEHWQQFDPVKSYYDFLEQKNLLDGETRLAISKEIEAEVQEAFDFAINSPNPIEDDLYTHVYSD